MHDHGWLPITPEEAKALRKITIVACGTAYHAGIYGKYAIEKLARVPVEVDIASEYRYRSPMLNENESLYRHLPKRRNGRYPGRAA